MRTEAADVRSVIHDAIAANRLTHALLLKGRNLEALVRMAHEVAGRILGTPVDKVEGHADFFLLRPTNKMRQINVVNTRELIRLIQHSPSQGSRKVALVMEVDRMNREAANAFLKTLEEPPDKTIFLLLCENPQSLLPTLVSRCQRIDLDAFRDLEEPWKSRVLEILASPLWGRPLENLALSGELAEILGEMKGEAERRVREETKQTGAVEEDGDVLEARVSSRYREMRTDFQLTLLRWYRDLMVLRAGGGPGVVFHQSRLEVLRERAARLPLDRTFANLGFIEDSARKMERSIPDDTVLAYTLDRIDHGVA